MHTKVKLLGGCWCRPYSNYWGGHSQIIGGIYPHPSQVSAPLGTACIDLHGTWARKKSKCWSAKENITIEIECPAMVEKYNAHIRGVDLCYMLLSLYRIRLRTCKYYMHMVYYCMGISITNGWLLYQRYFEQKHGSKKRPNGFVSISIERCKCSSGQQGKGYP